MTRALSPHPRATVTIAHADWMALATAIERPWPPEAVRIDLDFREQLSDADRAVFGRSTCMNRWGWTEKRVRTAFEGRGPTARR